MTDPKKTLVCLNQASIAKLISTAKHTIVYAAPSISETVAKAILAAVEIRESLSAQVVVQAAAEAFRLGYGEFQGLKLLAGSGISVTDDCRLQIGLLAVDEIAYVFAPTPAIILDEPKDTAINAFCVPRALTQSLLRQFAATKSEKNKSLSTFPPKDQDPQFAWLFPAEPEDDRASLPDIAKSETDDLDGKTHDGTPAKVDIEDSLIGTTAITQEVLEKIENDLIKRPPKNFDLEREVQVYSSFLQFVELSFKGPRITTKKVQLPPDLLSMVEDADLRITLRASCELFEDGRKEMKEVVEFERKILELRRHFTRVLGNGLGSVVLMRDRSAFDKKLAALYEELESIKDGLDAQLLFMIEKNKNRIIDSLVPVVLANPPYEVSRIEGTQKERETQARSYLEWETMGVFPEPSELVEAIQLSWVFKDVTYEMLNNDKFVDAIKECFPDERFERLYDESSALGEADSNKDRAIGESNDDWPDLFA